MNKINIIFLIILVLNFINNAKSIIENYELTDITNDIGSIENTITNNIYAQNSQCTKISFVHIKLLQPTTSGIALPYVNGNDEIIQLNQTNFILKVVTLIQGLGDPISKNLTIIDGQGIVNTAINFFTFKCVNFVGSFTNTPYVDTIYRDRHYKGFHGFLAQSNTQYYMGKVSVDEIVFPSITNGYFGKQLSHTYRDIDRSQTIYNIKPSIGASNSGYTTIIQQYKYPSGYISSTPFTITTFINSTTKNSTLINELPVNNCNNLKYQQCLILLSLNLTDTNGNFYLTSDNIYDRPIMVGGTLDNGDWYYQFTRFSDNNTCGVYSFNGASFQLLVPSKTNIKYVGPKGDPANDLSKSISINLYLSDPTIVYTKVTFISKDYFGDFMVDTGKFEFHNPSKVNPAFPFISSGSLLSVGEIIVPTSQYSTNYNQFGANFYFSNYPYSSFPWAGNITPTLIDTFKPEFLKVEYFDSPGLYCTVRISAIDTGGSGIQLIVITFKSLYDYGGVNNVQSTVRITNMDLIEGDMTNGVYQVKIPKYIIRKDYYIEMNDFAGNSAATVLYPNSFYSTNGYLSSFPYKILGPKDIKSISFTHSSPLVLTNTSASSTMIIKLLDTSITNLAFQFTPSYGVNIYQPDIPLSGEEPFFTGIYNEVLGQYEIPFTLPANLPSGPISYLLNPIEIDSSTFYSYLGSSSELLVHSDYVDTLGPIVKGLTIISPGSLTIPISGSITIGFNIEIHDDYNGIKEVNITIGSELDIVGSILCNQQFQPNILEYTLICTWQINDGDAPQTYKILKMSTLDYQGYSTEYPNPNRVNPLFFFVDSTAVTTITTINIGTPADTTVPVLSNFIASHTVISNPNDRKLIFNFTISDLESGINLNLNPSVTLVAGTLNFISNQPSTIIRLAMDQNKVTIITYSYEIELPHLFGYPLGFFAHIHGVMNNRNGYVGFSPQTIGNGSFIKVELTQQLPLIDNVLFDAVTGKLTIYGLNFGTSPKVIINSTDGLAQVDISTPFIGGNVIIFDPTSLRTSDPKPVTITIATKYTTISRGTLYQFILPALIPIISPTPTTTTTPTPTQTSTPIITDPPLVTNKPSPCKGTPLCGGSTHGTCESLGCNCISPWFGIDCLSKVVTGEITPIINETNPQVELPYIPNKDDKQIKVSSLISIYSLRELDYNKQVVNEYVFNQLWEYNESLENDTYSYSTIIINENDPTKNSTVHVLVKKFKELTTVQFAGQNIIIQPSSIKYYITISSYQFKQHLNSMDLLMYASIHSTQTENVCSDSEFGDSTSQLSSHYLKVTINDVSLFGEFIKRAIVDGKIYSISNRVLTESEVKGKNSNTASNSNSYISIEIPSFSNSIEIDPNFSVLLNVDDASNNDNSICNSNSNSGLTKPQLIGIIIGSVGVAIVASIIIGAIIYKKSTNFRIRTKSFKMRNFSFRSNK